MELQQIIDRYAQGMAAVDASTTTEVANRRTKEIYPLALRSLQEVTAVEEVDAWWTDTYPSDFTPPPNSHGTNYPYPDFKGACDHFFTTDGQSGPPEWAIEIKKITFVGNNGNNN